PPFFSMMRPPPKSTLFPYTTLFRSICTIHLESRNTTRRLWKIFLRVIQIFISENFSHKQSKYPHRCGSPLPISHAAKTHATVFCAGPTSINKLRRDANKPSIRIAVRRTGLATNWIFQSAKVRIPTQSRSSSSVHYPFQHINHSISSLTVQRF